MKLAKIHAHAEPIWHVQLAIAVAIIVQIFINPDYIIGPRFGLAIFEVLALVVLSLPQGRRLTRARANGRRLLAISLLAAITATNIASIILVSYDLLNGVNDGQKLIYSALAVFPTNIIIIRLLYWELDSQDTNQPGKRRDFLFPQIVNHANVTLQPVWRASFFDYLYVSVTNACTFGPTETAPLTHRAKLLMGLQSLTSLAAVALVAARAVNILK